MHMFWLVPQLVTKSTQTDWPPPATDDRLACDILQSCGTDAVEAYHQSHPYCTRDIHWGTLPEPNQSDQQKFVEHKLQEGKHWDKRKKRNWITTQR